ADRRACSQGRRQTGARQEGCKAGQNYSGQDYAGQDCSRRRGGEAREESGREKGRNQAEIGGREQGARAGGFGRQDERGQTCADFEACEEERRQGPRMNKRGSGFPGRDAIVAFVRANPGKVGTKEIAREFGLKNADRAELKRILRELADEGAIRKRGKKVSEPAVVPATVMADITGRDADGELIAAPAEWDEVESGEPPKIRI